MKTHGIKKPTKNDIETVLRRFGINTYNDIKLIDSSHGDDDIRWNYLIDKKYVLRFNSVAVMSEQRIDELNRLIERYREFGLVAPSFLKSKGGNYLVAYLGLYCYLSEYEDYNVAEDNIKSIDEDALINEIRLCVAGFAETYKNFDLSNTMSMYSIFELSPYDKLTDIDEKQENLNSLTETLNSIGETELAQAVKHYSESARTQLLTFYKTLPRCVFQGDENYSNVLVDKDGHLIGFIDFNMAGSDVIANYLANIIGFDLEKANINDHSAKQILDVAIAEYKKGIEQVSRRYNFTRDEITALDLYGKIVLISSYPNERYLTYYLNSYIYKDKALELLHMITETNCILDGLA